MTRILTFLVFFLALCGTAAAQCSFSNPTACGSPGVNNLAVGGNLTVLGSTTLSSLNNTPIGNITPSTGAFTTLGASGTTTLGTGSTTYLQLSGDPSVPNISTAGGATNIDMKFIAKGTGGFQFGSATSGNMLRLFAASGSGGGLLTLTQPNAATSPIVMGLTTNTTGLQWNNVQQQFVRNWTYAGLFSDALNSPFTLSQSIQGTSANTDDYGIARLTQSYTNFQSGFGARGLQVWTQAQTGTVAHLIGLRVSVSQESQPGQAATWTTSHAYTPTGQLIANGTNLYRLTTPGTSASGGGGPTGTGGAITDGTAVWAWDAPLENQNELVGLGVQNTAQFNIGGISSAPVGDNFGAVIGANSSVAATFYNQNVVAELDDDMLGTANRAATLQLVKRGNQGFNQDWGISFAMGGSNAWVNPLIFQSAVDPNGVAIAFEDQNTAGLQTMAGALDMRMVTATGTSTGGGGFLLRGPNWSWVQSGAINLRYGAVTPTSSGLSFDVPNTELTAAVPTGDGSNWSIGMWAKDQYGNYVTIATVSGTAPATVALQIKGQVPVGSVPATSTFTSVTPNSFILTATGTAVRPVAFTATLTYAAPGTPTLAIGPTSATQISLGNSGSNTTLAGTLTLATSTTGAATQTFTNSPCSGLTSERWVPVAITGQTGTWYVPACQ
jgi:hypothetical protein